MVALITDKLPALIAVHAYFSGRERVRSGFRLQPLDFGVEGRGQVCNQGLDVAHLMLNRQHRNALRHEVIDHVVLPYRNHQKRRRPVLPHAALLRVSRNVAGDGTSLPAIGFLAVQRRHIDVEAARHLTHHAAERWDSGAPLREVILDVSSAKLFATQAVVRVTQAALHVGGGWGQTEELPAMRMALDALVAPVTVGSYEIPLRAIAREMGLPMA